MTRVIHWVSPRTLAGAVATAASTLSMIGATAPTGLIALESAFEKGAPGMRPDLFIPNELETHMIVFHAVEPKQIAHYRRFCKERGQDYAEFLETNHRFMSTRGDVCSGA